MHLFSSIAKEILGTFLKAFRRIFVSFVLVFLIVAAGVEAAGFYVTGKLPPGGTTHLAAAALALAFGFAVGLTVAVEEILRGIVKAIEMIVKEAEKLAGEAVQAVERVALGESRQAQD
jgi:hypothetical protein